MVSLLIGIEAHLANQKVGMGIEHLSSGNVTISLSPKLHIISVALFTFVSKSLHENINDCSQI